MPQLPIYFDNHATTRTDPRVLEVMLPYFSEKYGNAASKQHVFGWQAGEAVETAREHVAALIGASPKEIVFTSGGTESNNLAIKGAACQLRKRQIITVATEHRSVLDPCRRLEEQGFRITRLPVDGYGRIEPSQIDQAISEDTALVSVMAANNEVGTLHPVSDIGKICKQRGVLFHSDAVQAVGKIGIDVEAAGIDLLTISGHKIYGPKGVGALYVRRRDPRVRLQPIFDGGGHERGLRSGTLPVPEIVGLGKACQLCGQLRDEEWSWLRALRDRLWQRIKTELPEAVLNGHPVDRLPGNLNVSFPYINAEALLVSMKDVAASTGSACTSASMEPSHVLKAVGLTDELIGGSVRFGLGRFNTTDEVDFVASELAMHVRRLQAINPFYNLAREAREIVPNL
jgi:cysteine desulfurase